MALLPIKEKALSPCHKINLVFCMRLLRIVSDWSIKFNDKRTM